MIDTDLINQETGGLESRYELELSTPSTAEYVALRSKVGWGALDPALADTALANSLFSVIVRRNEELVGMARIVGDGALFYYLQDVVVAPDFQGNGIGHLLMRELEKYLSVNAKLGSTIGLLSANGKEDFYQAYGYQKRTGQALGLGMSKFV